MSRAFTILACLIALALPASAQQVEQRAFEEIPNGIFIRGGTTVINTDARCAQGCPSGQACRQVCDERPCAADAPPDALCSQCDWRCAD